MCGIAGFVGASPREDVRGTIEQMLSLIGHRGPDQAGYYLDDDIVMGTSRLSVIDLASGQQPMGDAAGRYWICYNGEVFNYRELREELIARGARFATECDTEVLLQAWIAWGPEALQRLNGPFAFAVYDRAEKTLVLARDRYGVRPLFYAVRGNRFMFASEMKSFLACDGFEFRFDPEQLASVFSIWTPLETQTAFKDIVQLPLGAYLTCRDGRCSIERYARLNLRPSRSFENVEEAAEFVREEMRRSVRVRLRSDVPVGTYLSGGLDSTIVTRLAAEESATPLSTFSVAFAEQAFDESEHQAEAANFYGTTHTTLRVANRDIADNLPDAVWHAETPFFRTAPVPMLLLSRCVRDAGIKVALTGEGADEAFLGYDIFKETLLRDAWDASDDARRRELIGKVYPYLGHFNNGNASSLVSYYGMFAHERTPGLFSHETRFHNASFSRRLLAGSANGLGPLTDAIHASGEDFFGLDRIQRAQWLEYKTLLAGYLLSSQGDRMSMANGVENRCPFLDPSVVAAAMSVNLRFDAGFDEKHVLKAAFKGELPASILRRSKQPYLAPDVAPFLETRPDYLDALLTDAALANLGFLNTSFCRAFITKLMATPATRISPRESQAFVLLLSLALLNQFFVKRSWSIATARPAPIVRVVDRRIERRDGAEVGGERNLAWMTQAARGGR